MKSVKLLTLVTATASALLLSSQAAAVLPISVNAKAGASDVKYGGKSATGYTWSVSGSYDVNTFSSIDLGYAETRATIPDASDVDRDYKAYYVPLTLTLRAPIVVGDAYVRGGGSYYNNTYFNEEEDGYGFIGAVGLRMYTGPGPIFSIEVGYSDNGSAESTTISIGASQSF
ncbi:hypothetical protein NF212_20070 [Parasalinivibrio latis]|uniref:hypothetical protein n=1 Tax=Parasalinivibrio latis TaxID=2952610 RepID=UPI0030E599A9